MRGTAVLLILFAFAPLATAHGDAAWMSPFAEVEGLSLFLLAEEGYPVENEAFDLELIATLVADGSGAEGENVTLHIRGPGGEQEVALLPRWPGSWNATLSLPSRGQYSVSATLPDAGVRADLTLQVFASVPHRLKFHESTPGQFSAGRPVEIRLLTRDVETGVPVDAPRDGFVTIANMDGGGERVTRALKTTGAGDEVVLSHAFPTPGIYDLWLASSALGVDVGDVPPLRALVVEASAAEPPAPVPRATPSLSFAAITVLIALAAVTRRA